jgi:predicted metal-dependent phosphoesterase TrpH
MTKVKDLDKFPEKKKSALTHAMSFGGYNNGFNKARNLIGNLEIPQRRLDKGKVKELSNIIINKIVADLTDRSGLRQEWGQIDNEIQNEIEETWIDIIFKAFIKAYNKNELFKDILK